MTAIIRRVAVQGRVQGVGYRAWLADEAGRRALEGWVRNRRDGSVEALFAGSEVIVAAMIQSCHRGPTLARVEAVDIQLADADQLDLRRPGERFSVLPTV